MTRPPILPPYAFLASVVAMLALHYFGPWPPWPGPAMAWRWAGAAVCLAGLGLAIAGNRRFQIHGTPTLPFERSTALVTDGPFRFTRNPMYLGLVTALVGLALGLGVVAGYAFAAAVALYLDRRFIRNEERMMDGLFGEDYRAYRARVRRWV